MTPKGASNNCTRYRRGTAAKPSCGIAQAGHIRNLRARPWGVFQSIRAHPGVLSELPLPTSARFGRISETQTTTLGERLLFRGVSHLKTKLADFVDRLLVRVRHCLYTNPGKHRTRQQPTENTNNAAARPTIEIVLMWAPSLARLQAIRFTRRTTDLSGNRSTVSAMWL